MDSRESPAPPPSSMMMGTIPQPQPNSYTVTTTTANNSTMITPNSTYTHDARFPFSSAQPMDSLNYGDRSSSAGGFSFDGSKKKRGRPRKYSPDGNIALGLAPNPINPISTVTLGDSSGGTPSSEPSLKRGRGRPAGSGKKQLNALGAPGVMFTPHVITVKEGEDIASKIMAFSQQGPRTVCILSANGAISNVTLRQAATSGGTVTYEGGFEIISLTGSFFMSENNGNRSRTGSLSVSLAGSDGRVLGGGVAGMLTAATPVQVIVGSFIADGKKSKSGPSVAPLPNMLNFGGPVVGVSPPSLGASSESSEENGSPPLNHDAGIYSNVSQPIQNNPMYTNMAWANSTAKMHPN